MKCPCGSTLIDVVGPEEIEPDKEDAPTIKACEACGAFINISFFPEFKCILIRAYHC